VKIPAFGLLLLPSLLGAPARAQSGPVTADPAPVKHDRFWNRVRLTRTIEVTAPLPFTGAGGRVGLATEKEMLEIGVESQVFFIPPGRGKYPYDGAVGATAGAYLTVAPIPGGWGSRFCLRGSVLGAFSLGRPSFDAFGVDAALVYRQPVGHLKHIFLEIGVQRDVLYSYDDILLSPRLAAGYSW